MNIATIVFLVTPRQVWLAPKKRSFAVGYLNGYGGKIDGNETPVQAAIRETFHESGVLIFPRDLIQITVLDFIKDQTHAFLCHIFLATRWHGQPYETEEMGPPELHPRYNLPLDRMLPGDRLWLPRVMIGRIIPPRGYIKYNDDMTSVIDYRIPESI